MKKLVGFGFIILCVWYSLFIIQPPAPKPVTAPDATFSAGRAFKHVQEIGKAPHPLGSKGNTRVRNYIVGELHQLGLHPVIQQGIALVRGSALAGDVKNILVKIPGSASKKTVMLMAHYDSVPNGPGAGDDGFGVATILETLRALEATKPLKNNLWVLFTDGEERGLLGAEYFIQANDDWKEVDLAINIEARGTSGPSIMFETSSGNEHLIPAFAKASAHPVANSISYTVYKLIPNDTDLSVLKRAGLKGLNFANIKDVLNYHTMQDRPANISKATLQHHGDNILANIRYFGNTNFEASAKSDAVYFNSPFGGLIYYPASWSFPIAVLSSIIFLIFLVLLFWRKVLAPGKYLLGLLSFLLMCLLGSLLTYGGWQLIKMLNPSYQWLALGETYAYRWYLGAFSALMLALSIAGYQWLQNKLGYQSIVAGVLTFIMMLNLLVAWYLPTAGYLFTWPFMLVMSGWVFIWNDTFNLHWRSVFILCLCTFPALFIITPYIPLVQITLTTAALWISMFLLMLLIGLCWPLIYVITKNCTIYWALGFAVLFSVCMIGASLHSGYDTQHKKQNSIMYAQDLDDGKSFWLSSDYTTDSYTKQYLGDHPAKDFAFDYSPYWSAPFLMAPAPYKEIEAPTLSIQSDSLTNHFRYLSLRLVSHYGGLTTRFKLASGQNFKHVSIFNRTMFDADHPVAEQRSSLNQFYYFGDVSKPVDFSIAFPDSLSHAALNVQIISKTWPRGLMQDYKPRDKNMMPIPFGISDAVIYKKTYSLRKLDK